MMGVDPLVLRTDDATFDIVGQYEAFVVVTYVDKAIAQRILPAEFELAPPPDTPDGKHPVMYSFGKHRHVHPDGLKLYEYDYDEALIGLPHVIYRGTLMPHYFHMTDVRLNNTLATGIGVALGFPKKMALIDNEDLSYAISDGTGSLLNATMRVTGRQFHENHPNFRVISPLMQQPVISKTPPPLSSIIVTGFSIDTANAFMVPATMRLEVASNNLAGLPKGTHEFDTIDSAAFGGAYMSVHSWRMTQRPSVILV